MTSTIGRCRPKRTRSELPDARARQHQVIDDGEAEHGGERHEQAHARPAPLGVAARGAVFGFELGGKSQVAAGRARCMAPMGAVHGTAGSRWHSTAVDAMRGGRDDPAVP